MYDKVGFWLDREDIRDDMSLISNRLCNAEEVVNRETGEVKIRGKLDNLRVSVCYGGCRVVGSLAGYYNTNNIYPVDRGTTKKAITKISDNLGVDVNKAKVTSLEFGTVLLLNNKVSEYLKCLGEMSSKFNRCNVSSDTLYYKKGNRQSPVVYAFYDKIKEARVKGLSVPIGFEGQHLLKYEFRLRGHLARQLKVGDVKASTLHDEYFYQMLLNKWRDDYFAIKKRKQIDFTRMSKIKTVNDAINVYYAILEGEDVCKASSFVEALKNANVFSNRTGYYRLRLKLQEIRNNNPLAVSDKLIKELDDAILNTCAYT